MENRDAAEVRSVPTWNPDQYNRFGDHRLRPSRDLLARVPELPRPTPRIADLGCGPGAPTTLLAARWPDAHITGYDRAPAMLEQARAHAGPTTGGGRLDFVAADLADWRPAEPHDLLFSNAAFHWWPGHQDAFPAYVDALTPGGTLAFQVPGNHTAPSHVLLEELLDSPRWRSRVGARARLDAVLPPAAYVDALTALGCGTDVWETTYLHVLPGENPVLEWAKGTALRPVLTLLAGDPEARDALLGEYAAALRAAYPPGPHGTLFPFRRIFAVAVKR